MNDNFYFLIILFLTVFMLCYGGHNFQKKIIYNSDYFLTGKTDSFIKKIAESANKTNINFNENYVLNITDKSLIKEIPNCSNIFVINIKLKSFINVKEIMNKIKLNTDMHLMITCYFDKTLNNNKYLNILVEQNDEEKSGLFYVVDKKINVTDIYNIYNPNNVNILFLLLLIKKPFWYN
jgi:hypothetical protein